MIAYGDASDVAGSRCCVLYEILVAADGTRITVTASIGNHANTYRQGARGWDDSAHAA